MLEINYSLLIQIGNFIILILILNIILYRPIRKILGRRNDEMSSLQKMIDDFRDRFVRNEKDLEGNMIGARKEGYKEKEDLKGEGLDEERALLQDAASSTEEKIRKARNDMRDRVVKVRNSLQSEMEVFSKELAEKILGRSIS